MSNNTNKHVAELAEDDVYLGHNDDTESLQCCSKCGGSRITFPEPRLFDQLISRVTAKHPYRCLDCQHRFWAGKPTSYRHLDLWWVVAISLVVILGGISVLKMRQSPEPSPVIEVTVPEFESGRPVVDPVPSFDSLISVSPNDQDTSVESPLKKPEMYSGIPQESLTPEQKAQRLSYAKQQAELAEQAVAVRVARLEQALLADQEELESLARIEVAYAVERWREAWALGEIESYLSSYGDDFIPAGNITRKSWAQDRQSKVTPQRNIQVELSELSIFVLEQLDSAVVEFKQRYQSGNYLETSRKRLKLMKRNGQWKINSELELN